MNHGLQLVEQSAEDFVFGANKLGDQPVVAGGDWSPWLPIPEDQDVNGIEPFACCTFALLNAVETMLLRKYGESQNLSDRWLAFKAGTAARMGNDPHTVAETLRKGGDVQETDWPFDSTINTFAKFYTPPPSKLDILAQDFTDEINFGHEWVGTDQESMMQALEYSPLTAGVFAWKQDPQTGYYISPPGTIQEHDVMIYGYERNYYFLAFDSYENNHKKLAWDFKFVSVKRYTLERQIVDNSAFARFLALIRQILGL